MNKGFKKNLIIGGSIVSAILLSSIVVLGFALGEDKVRATQTESSNDFGIGAFANMESFDNDGFNNGVKKAAEQYLNLYKGNDSYFINSDKSVLDKKVSFYSDDGREYVDLLQEQFSNNDIIISSGFQAGQAISGIEGDFDGVFTDKNGVDNEFANSNQKAFILLDDEALSTKYTNAATVSYAAEGAGYLSAQIAWAYTQYDAEVNGKATPNIVMWGGKAFPTVYNYMSGFAQGIEELNNKYNDVVVNGHTMKEVTLWSGGDSGDKVISASNEYDASLISDMTHDGSTWYTGGFDAATGTPSGDLADAKSRNAINEGASIIFPIAGGNTNVAETVIVNSSSDTTTKLIGVDADATIASSHDELYLASAQKNLIDGGTIALWAMDDFDNNGIRNIDDNISPEDNVGILIEENNIISEWEVSETTDGTPVEGKEFRGTMSNGGVDVILGTQQQGGKDNLDSTLEFFDATEEELVAYIDSLKGDIVLSSDGNFADEL